MKNEFLNVGVIKIEIENIQTPIYDKERMLIELIRYRTKLSYELYKEVINNYTYCSYSTSCTFSA